MNDEQPPPTAPGFHSLPIAPERPVASAPLRGAWSLRRRAATAVAALALVGTGGAVAAQSLTATGHQGGDSATPPTAPAHPGTTSPAGDQTDHRSGRNAESDEA